MSSNRQQNQIFGKSTLIKHEARVTNLEPQTFFSGLRSRQFVFLELVPQGAFQEFSGRG